MTLGRMPKDMQTRHLQFSFEGQLSNQIETWGISALKQSRSIKINQGLLPTPVSSIWIPSKLRCDMFWLFVLSTFRALYDRTYIGILQVFFYWSRDCRAVLLSPFFHPLLAKFFGAFIPVAALRTLQKDFPLIRPRQLLLALVLIVRNPN